MRRPRPCRSAVGALAVAGTVTVALLGAVGVSSADPPPTVTVAGASAAAASTRVVVLGDSVAVGTACGCTPFAGLLAQDLAATSGSTVAVTNAARAGLTSQGLLNQLRGGSVDSSLRRATVVTVTIGANDFDPSAARRNTCGGTANIDCYRDGLNLLAAHVSAVLTELAKRTPSTVHIVLTGYWNVFLDGAVARQQGATYVRTSDALTRAVNQQISSVTGPAGASYVDLYAPFEDGSLARLTALLAPDGDHPSAAGHALIARLVMAAAVHADAGAVEGRLTHSLLSVRPPDGRAD